MTAGRDGLKGVFPATGGAFQGGSILYVIDVEFLLHGCQSLKEKRSRLAGFRQRVGRQTGVALIESEHADSHGRSGWTLAVLTNTARSFDPVRDAILKEAERVDAELVRFDCEAL